MKTISTSTEAVIMEALIERRIALREKAEARRKFNLAGEVAHYNRKIDKVDKAIDEMRRVTRGLNNPSEVSR